MRQRHSTLGGLLRGMVAGAVATWAMNKVTSLMYEREDKTARRREDQARRGRTAYQVAAEKFARLGNRRLNKEDRQDLGNAVHWALGTGASALYGALRPRFNGRGGLLSGLAFGTTVWLILDNLAVYGLKLTPGPRTFPWQTHARGLVGHLAYGAVADTALRVMP